MNRKGDAGVLTCREVSELVSQSIERPLSRRERWGVRLHLLICRMCARFKAQVEFLHVAARDYAHRGALTARQLQLSATARERIRQTLARAP